MQECSTFFRIVLPFKSNIEYLKLAIESVIGQSYTNWSLLVIDDYSKIEEVPTIVSSYCHERITFLAFKEPQGINKIFNYCLGEMYQDWNILMGADDLMDSNFLANLNTATNLYPAVAIIQPGVKVIDSFGKNRFFLGDTVKGIIRFKQKEGLIPAKSALRKLALGNWLYFPSLVWAGRVLEDKEFNPNFHIALDMEMYTRIFYAGGQVLYWPKAKFKYRRHSYSASMQASNFIQKIEEEVNVLNAIARHFLEIEDCLGVILTKIRISLRMNIFFNIIRPGSSHRKLLFQLMFSGRSHD